MIEELTKSAVRQGRRINLVVLRCGTAVVLVVVLTILLALFAIGRLIGR